MPYFVLKSIHHAGSNNHGADAECYSCNSNANNESRKTLAAAESNFAYNKEFCVHGVSLLFSGYSLQFAV